MTNNGGSNKKKLSIIPVSPRPFIKWVGGKTQLLPELAKRVPKDFARYYEPFIGGGALFFHLQPSKAILTDINPDLINLYIVVRDKVRELIEELKRHVYDKTYYYQMRNIDRTSEYEGWSDVQRASRLIYLNKSCYNGLYRLNSQGQFNVPFGRYTDPTILDVDNLLACHFVLQGSTVEVADFGSIYEKISSRDFVYFDPPYAPLSATSNFTSYTRHGFDIEMHYALKKLCLKLDAKGVRFMLSNSSAPLILDLFADFNTELVYATRAINSNAKKRGKIHEVVVTNY